MCLPLVIKRGLWLEMGMTHTPTIPAVLRKTALAAALLFSVSSSSFAGESPSTVVELFTSQGCSSCPPANEFVGKLSEDEDVLALTYGVTYWDYLGWKDTFGDAAFTKRQRAYGRAFGIGNVYTPQIVLNGSAHSPRYSETDVRTMSLPESKSSVDLSSKDGALVLNADVDVTLVSYKPGWQEVPVKAGENHGKTLRLANVVMDVTAVKAGTQLSKTAEDGLAYAALVHDPDTMKVLSASIYSPK